MSYKRSLFDLLAPPFDWFSGGNLSSHKPLVIVGHGRSGTTWVGRTFSRHPRVLYYNEPCRFAPESEELLANYFSYVTSSGNAGLFKTTLDAAMKGRSLWKSAEWMADRGKVMMRLLGRYRIVIKEVASIMSVEWIRREYVPDFLVLFRHPCSVVLSELEQHTDAQAGREFLLKLTALFEDHLYPYESLIRKAGKPYEVLGAIYGARNRVLANFVEKHRIETVMLYEDLSRNPHDAFARMFGWYGLDLSDSMRSYIATTTTKEEPGAYGTTKDSAAHIDRWKRVLTRDEAMQIRDFVLPFGLPYYSTADDYLPS